MNPINDLPYDRTTPGDAEHREYEEAGVDWAVDADGLPVPMAEQAGTVAPLDPETFVCMADTSVFVLRSEEGQVEVEFDHEVVERRRDGTYYVPSCLVREQLTSNQPSTVYRGHIFLWHTVMEIVEEAILPPAQACDRAIRRRLALVGCYPRIERGLCDVQPRRPACSHYWRYKVDMTGNAEHQDIERVCAAQRDENGLLLSVRNMRLHACEMRTPRHPETEGQLDRFDEELIRKGRERTRIENETFDVDQALEQQEEQA